MGGYIIDHFSDRERIKALIVMTKVYALHIFLSYASVDESITHVATKHCLFRSSTRSWLSTISQRRATSS
jgi:hypothetical protein